MTIRVVIAEDEAIIRMDLRETLEEEGYEVVGETGRGDTAVELVRDLLPDLAILDIKMPGMDGLEAARLINAEKLCGVLVLTAFSQREVVEEARDAGALAYLVKPFQKSDLVPAIEVAIGRFRELRAMTGEIDALGEQLEARKVDRTGQGGADGRAEDVRAGRLHYIQRTAMSERSKMRQIAERIIDGLTSLASSGRCAGTRRPNARDSSLLCSTGNSLTYRAFFALPQDMSTASGQLTNAVFGFTSMFINVLKEQRPDEVLVAFDRPEPTFRHEADATYKANREAAPDTAAPADGPGARGARRCSASPRASCAGWEADDIIATVVEQAVGRGDDVLIVTGDRDAYQLVQDPHVRVLYNRRGVSDYALYDEAGIFERTGVTPAQYPEYAAMRGDPSDNLPGVPGVGEKTAAKLIQTYGGLDGIFEQRRQADAEAAGLARRARGAGPQEPRDDDPAPRRADRAARVAGHEAGHGRGPEAVRLPRVPHVRRAPGRGPRAGGRRAVERRARAAGAGGERVVGARRVGVTLSSLGGRRRLPRRGRARRGAATAGRAGRRHRCRGRPR